MIPSAEAFTSLLSLQLRRFVEKAVEQGYDQFDFGESTLDTFKIVASCDPDSKLRYEDSPIGKISVFKDENGGSK